MSSEDVLREDGDEEEEAVEQASQSPAVVETEESVDSDMEEDEATPADLPAPEGLGDAWYKEIMADPLKKEVFQSIVAKESKRAKDEWAGKTYGWMRRDIRDRYVGKQDEFERDLQKAQDYDKVVAELEQVRKTSVPPPPQAIAKEEPKENLDDMAKEFVEAYNLQDEQIGMVKGLLELVDKRHKPSAPPVDVAAELAKLEWQKEEAWAKSQVDYKTNADLRALAHGYSQEGASPKESVLKARHRLGLDKPVKVLKGPSKAGVPAFSKDADARPIKDSGYRKGEDPLDALKAKYSREG